MKPIYKKYVISEVENISKYLSDKKYCIKDTDCSFREYFCTKGFYNEYQQIVESHEGCYSKFDEYGNTLVSEVDDLKCKPVTKYDSIACVDSKCTGLNYKYSCK
jgi:hypothetical protein